MRRPNRSMVLALVLVLFVLAGYFLFYVYMPVTADTSGSMFRRVVVDAEGPREPWGKSVGDIDGDGLPDLLVGGHGSQELVWYRNPTWTKQAIAGGEAFGTDHEIVDVDGDGKRDVVSITGSDLRWYRNGDWSPSIVSTVRLHDIEVADLDGDGDMDIVGRNQSAFGGSAATIFLFEQIGANLWRVKTLGAPEGEGLKVIDLNDDGRPDIVVNGTWFENLSGSTEDIWRTHKFSDSWAWPHAFIDVGDVNGDGRLDIAMAPAELAGERYRLSWFEAPSERGKIWTEHIIDPDVEAVMHFVGLGDVDGDGDTDVMGAAMHQGADPDNITVYVNGGQGRSWFPEVVGKDGSHSMRMADLDQDGDIDLFGANWSGEQQAVEVWENQTCPGDGAWRRHVVDPDLPWTAVFVIQSDLDQDGFADIVAGAWWYRNPGLIRRPWKRRPLGAGVNQVVAVLDLDGNRYPDIVAATGDEGVYTNGSLSAIYNSRAGLADPNPVASVEGDFLQGVATGNFGGGEATQLALSWHAAGAGVQLLTVSGSEAASWSVETISELSQDEALSVGDIDRDGDLDLFLGTKWLRNDTTSWSAHSIAPSKAAPDRNRLADINGDGRLDAVVGFEAISVPGDLVWYEQPASAESLWTRHDIARITGPMSLDVADLDQDGDLDVVAGEHNPADPDQAGLFWYANADGKGGIWEETLIYRGDEHHDGAQLADLDGDGDLDVISIGWEHGKVLVYENRRNACGARN